MTPTASIDTRHELIRVAMDLMLEKGWTGFSYKDISNRVGIRKASIHYHFPTKDDLGLAVIAAWRDMYANIHTEIEQKFPNVFKRFAAILSFMEEHFLNRHICPAGILDADFMNLSTEMQDATRAWNRDRLKLYAAWLDEGRKQGSLKFHGTPEAQAIALMSGLQGAIQIERTMGNGTFKQFTKHAFAGLKA